MVDSTPKAGVSDLIAHLKIHKLSNSSKTLRHLSRHAIILTNPGRTCNKTHREKHHGLQA